MANKGNIGVFAFLFDDQDRILLVKRNYGDRTWALPGGTIEFKEGALEALNRELKEEIGITVSEFEFNNVCFAIQEYSIAISFRVHLSKNQIRRLSLQGTSELEDMKFFSHEESPCPMNKATFEKIRKIRTKKLDSFFEI